MGLFDNVGVGQRRAVVCTGRCHCCTAGGGFDLGDQRSDETGLGLLAVPDDISTAQDIWDGYSPDWQFWNQMRTVTSGVAVFCVGIGIMHLRGK